MDKEVNAFVRSQIIVVEPTSRTVAVINAGPAGAPGSPGPPGPGGGGEGFPIYEDDGSYTYTVLKPATSYLQMQVIDDDFGHGAYVQLHSDPADNEADSILASSVTGGYSAFVQAHADASPQSYVVLDTDGNDIRLYVGTISPDGVITAPQGSLYVNTTTPSLWINTDGMTSWYLYADGTGIPGAGGGSYEYEQVSASDIWTINHNLGFYPNVTVMDSAEELIVPNSISFPNTNQTVLTFSAPVAGDAYLS